MKTLVACLFVICIGLPLHAESAEGAVPIDEAAILAEMEALIESTPDLDEKQQEKAQKLIQKGVKAHDAQKYDKAIKAYRDALKIAPLSDLAYYEMAYSYLLKGDQLGALDAVTRALAINPKNEIYHVVRANALDDLGLRDQAISAYQELLELQPESYLGHLNLGITCIRAERFDMAEESFKRAIEVNPKHPSGYYHLARLYSGLGYTYDEQELLEKFVEVGANDQRLPAVQKRLESLTNSNISLNMGHPYSMIELAVGMARSQWQTTKHRETFPEARGYAVTYEEDRAVYDQLLTLWRSEKEDDPEASFAFYDLILMIDDAGFLDEYIWYNRQNEFGERGARWLEQNSERIDAFLAWARENDLVREPEAEADPLDSLRDLPLAVIQALDESPREYELAGVGDKPYGLLEREKQRFAEGLELTGGNRLRCDRVAERVDAWSVDQGADALIPVFRCFYPGDAAYQAAAGKTGSLGVEIEEISFRPVGHIEHGEGTKISFHGANLTYLLVKAAWPHESSLRPSDDDGSRPTILEELFAVRATVGAILNSQDDEDEGEVDDEEEEPGSVEDDPEVTERMLAAARHGVLEGFVLYEMIHKNYRIPLDRLEDDQLLQVERYLQFFVLGTLELRDR